MNQKFELVAKERPYDGIPSGNRTSAPPYQYVRSHIPHATSDGIRHTYVFPRKRFLLLPYLLRHANCDWGSICEEDKKENDESLKNGCRLLSQYELPDKTKIWIITEADRSSTTMLFPEDY